MMLAGPAFWCPQLNQQHICTSGPTWVATTIPSDRYSGLAQVGAQKWIATGHGRGGGLPVLTAVSTDNGQTWSAAGTMPDPGAGGFTPFAVCYGNGLLVAYCASALAWYSSDQGATWTQTSPGAAFGCNDLKFGNGLFVFAGTTAFTYSSSTGQSVTARATPAIFGTIQWIAAASWWLAFEAGGTRVYTSPDLVTWTLRGAFPYTVAVTTNNVAQNGLIVVAGQNDGSASCPYSTDGGVTWNLSSALPGTSIQDVIYGNGMFLAIRALGGIVMLSTDNGQTWINSPHGNLTTTKSWILGYDGVNNWLAVGAAASADTVANLGIC